MRSFSLAQPGFDLNTMSNRSSLLDFALYVLSKQIKMPTKINTDKDAIPSIHAESLSKQFGELTAVNNLSIKVKERELMALLGPNGAGKTTFVRMITGLLKPTTGTIQILGSSGGDLEKTRRTSVGYCPQRLIIWRDLTCIEQLLFIARMYLIEQKEAHKRAEELLDWFGLSSKAHELAANLSGGMQRRLSIAIAMVHDPTILVLDEPAAGLDPQSRVMVRKRIRSLSRDKGKTVVISTHDMDEADRISDRVAIMDQGNLLELDTSESLKKKYGSTSIVEIALPGLDQDLAEKAYRELSELAPKVRQFEDLVLIDSEDDGALMRPIRTVLAKLSIVPSEIRLRKRSLEDVFIELTGRRLRE